MFNDESIHVRNVQRTVRAGLDLGGTEPIICAGEELTFFLSLGSMASETYSVRFKHFPMDEIVYRFTDEDAASNGGVLFCE